MRELTQIYTFTGLKIIHNNKYTEQESNVHDDIHHKQNQKQNTTHKNLKTPDPKISQKERKNRKMIEKILSQKQIEKSEHRALSRLRKNHVKNTKHSSDNLK